MSLTREETIFPKAAPMTTPTAISTTLPRRAKSLNSLSMLMKQELLSHDKNTLKYLSHYITVSTGSTTGFYREFFPCPATFIIMTISHI